jgi:hypothetical protein
VVDADVALFDDAAVDVDVISYVVDEVDRKVRFSAVWAGATRGGAGRVLGGPAPKNRGSSRPNCARRESRPGLAALSI